MSYHYYRLPLSTHGCSNADTFCLRKTLQKLNLVFKNRKFLGENPILIFDFLTRLIEEADTLEKSEGKLMVLLPHLLTGGAGAQYRAAANGCRSGRLSGIIQRSEAVKHLLRTSNKKPITESIDDLKNVRQAENENYKAFAARLNNVVYQCGNFYEEAERSTYT